MILSESDIRAMVELIVQDFQPEKIILFGSYASGTANQDSDLDLLIVKESVLHCHHRSSVIRNELSRFKVPKYIVVVTPFGVQTIPRSGRYDHSTCSEIRQGHLWMN